MKKKIALDLDGVVFDTENLFRVYTEMYDIDIFKSDNLIKNDERLFQNRYNWMSDEYHKFLSLYYEKIFVDANIMTGADVVIKKLMEDYEFNIVTARSYYDISLGMPKLRQLELDKVKMISSKNKVDVLREENFYGIIDDEIRTCMDARDAGFYSIFFRNAASLHYEEEENFKVVNNWGEVYKCLKLKR